MLEFLAPWWLLGLAAVPVIYGLHRHVEAGVPLRVSALFLWPRADVDPRGAEPRRRHNPAWRRRAMAAALIALAAAAPRLKLDQAPRPLVWFDTGPAMAVAEPRGTRQALAVDALVTALRESGAAGAEIRDLWSTRPPLSLTAATPAAWEQALQHWLEMPAAAMPDVTTAPLPGPGAGLQWLVTDGAARSVADWATGMSLARVIQVGTVTQNAGIEGLAVRSAADGGDTLAGLARLGNAGPEPVERTLRLNWPGGGASLPALILEPGITRQVTFRLPAAAAGGTLGAALIPGDPLSGDDVLDLALARMPVQLQAGCPEPLGRLIGTLPGLDSSAGDDGLAITCGGGPQPPGQGPTLHVAATGGPEAVNGPVLWAPAAESLQGLILDPKALRARGTPPAGADWLLAAGPRPLIVESGPPDRRRIDVHLDLAQLGDTDTEGLALLLAGLVERLTPPGTARGLWQRRAATGVVPVAPRVIVPGGPPNGTAAATRSFDLDMALVVGALAVLLLDALRTAARPATLIPRLGLAAALALAWWLPVAHRAAAPADLVLLLDDSASVGREALDTAWRSLRGNLVMAAGELRLGILRFAGGVVEELSPDAEPAAVLGGDRPPRSRALDRGATNLETGLRQAARWRRPGRATGVLLVSDGRETAGNALPILQALHAAGISLWTLPPPAGAAPPRPTLRELQLPARMPATAPVPVTVLMNPGGDRVTLELDGVPAAPPILSAGPGGTRVARAWLRGLAAGFTRVTARAGNDSATEVVNIVGPARIGYVSASAAAAPLRQALLRQGYTLTDAVPEKLGALLATPDLAAVVLEDVAVGDADPAAWRTLERRVRSRGLGLLVLGGPHSFAAGGYRDSRLETLLPVVSEPPPGRPPVAVQFLVDSSGSMGPGAGGEDPISAAQAAVLAGARGLAADDRVGLTVFDVTGRVVLPLAPQAEAVAAVTSGWTPATGGGTRLREAFDDAVAALAATDAEHRLLVLISDGRLTDAPAAASLERLRSSNGRLVVLAVGGDPQGRLAALATAAEAPLLRVDETARLPQVAAAAVSRQLLPPRTGPLVPVVRGAARYLASFDALPRWSAASVTRPRHEAAVATADPDGLPLIAEWQAGLGRVMAVPGGFGEWAKEWVSWAHWPEVASAMVDRCAAGRADAGLDVRVDRRGGGTRLEVEAVAANGGWSTDPLSLRVRGPDGRDREVRLVAEAPGRYRTSLETPVAGVYGLRVGIEGRSLVHHFAAGTGDDERTGDGRSVLAEAAARGLTRPWQGLKGFLAAPAPGYSRGTLLILALGAWVVLLAVEQRPRTRQSP